MQSKNKIEQKYNSYSVYYNFLEAPMEPFIIPLTVNTFGYNINRNTGDTLRDIGFGNIAESNLFSDILKIFIITN